MTIKEKFFHALVIGILFSILNWFIIDCFIIKLSILKYVFIECILIVSIKLFKFTKLKLNLN